VRDIAVCERNDRPRGVIKSSKILANERGINMVANLTSELLIPYTPPDLNPVSVMLVVLPVSHVPRRGNSRRILGNLNEQPPQTDRVPVTIDHASHRAHLARSIHIRDELPPIRRRERVVGIRDLHHTLPHFSMQVHRENLVVEPAPQPTAPLLDPLVTRRHDVQDALRHRRDPPPGPRFESNSSAWLAE
jgi:hypothetical protein